MSTAFVHGRIATAMVLFTLVASIYGLVEYARHRSVSPSYWGVIILGNLLALGQDSLGVWMALGGAQPERGGVHVLYGVIAVLWIPLIQIVNRSRSGSRETLGCALVSLFEFGIALRAMATG